MWRSKPEGPTETCVVTNRVFLLGLDELYRRAVMVHERGELLNCARSVAVALGVEAADIPVEGYYASNPKLTRYFLIMRALQDVPATRIREVSEMPEFQRLQEVTGSPIYGFPVWNGKLLPVGRDALSQALYDTLPDWTVVGLTAAAHDVARETGDISLVGLAALAKESVVLAALRESLVLHTELVALDLPERLPEIVYVWRVDDQLIERAAAFIETFNVLFREDLPAPVPDNSERYWVAHDEESILGRCVRLGYDDRTSPVRYYHWATCRRADGQLTVQDFWDSEVWTTERYRAKLGWWRRRAGLEFYGRCPDMGE